MRESFAENDRIVTSRHHDVISESLGPIVGALLREDGVTDVYLNPDGRLWVGRLGQPSMPVGTMLPHDAETLISAQAGVLGVVATRASAVVEGELLTDGSRFHGMLPPLVANPVFCIRKKASALFPLDDYVAQEIMTRRQRRIIRGAVRGRQNILIVGGTGSGKTTLVNAIIAEIVNLTPDHRIIGIEDTAELQCHAENSVFLRTFGAVTIKELLRSVLRMFPDRIIVGEVRGGEALYMLDAWNTGHPGGICTLHSNIVRSRAALKRVERMISMAEDAPTNGIQGLIGEAIDLIVCIERSPGSPAGRRISSIHVVKEHDGKDYVLIPEDVIEIEEVFA